MGVSLLLLFGFACVRIMARKSSNSFMNFGFEDTSAADAVDDLILPRPSGISGNDVEIADCSFSKIRKRNPKNKEIFFVVKYF